MLYVEGLTKIFNGSIIAVQDVTFDVSKGELVSLLGPSGCGKTTTLRCIAGLESPTKGSIYIDGNDVARLPPHKRNIGMVFQFAVVYDSISVYENIALPLKAKKWSRGDIRKRVMEVSKLLELGHVIYEKPNTLDIGTRQKIALARAIVKDPRLYLLDEPLTILDPTSRVKLRSELKRLQKELQATILYVTHDQTESMSLADRIAVMRAGRVTQFGSPKEIYHNPNNSFVAHFVGQPGMNLLEVDANFEGDEATIFLNNTPMIIQKIPAQKQRERFLMGIRPEFVDLAEKRDKLHNIPAPVYAKETLGNRMFVHLNINEGSMIAKLPYISELPQKVWIHLPKSHLKFFDIKTEELLF